MATLITALSTTGYYYAAGKPKLLSDREVQNFRPNPVFISRLIAEVGTLVINKDNTHVDSGLREMPINRYLYYGEKTEIGNGLLFVDGKLVRYRIILKNDFFHTLKFNTFRAVAMPR